MLVVSSAQTFSKAFKLNKYGLASNAAIDDVNLFSTSYLRCHGIDVLALAQERIAGEQGRRLTPESSLRMFKERTVRKVEVEMVTVHLVPSFCVLGVSSIISAVRNYGRGETLLCVLSLCAGWSKLVQCFVNANIAFDIRLGQALSEFEIRRCEADVRTIDPGLIHRVTPRFKALLHECHHVGNASHGIFMMYVPIVLIHAVQLLAGVLIAVGEGGGEVEEDGGEGVGCVPAWVFAALGQPVLSTMVYIWGYGNLNLAIERDVDQDIVEMNIRLTYSDSHVPNWLLQQVSGGGTHTV